MFPELFYLAVLKYLKLNTMCMESSTCDYPPWTVDSARFFYFLNVKHSYIH